MLRQFPFHPPQYIGSLAASSHFSSLAPTLIPLYKPTPLDYLNYPLRYEALFLFLSWHMQRVNKTPSNPLWNCHQFTLSFTPITIKVALGFGHWNTEYNTMLCLSDHQTMAFKDQSTIPKATFIEIGISSFRISSLSDAHSWFTISKTFPEIPLAK